jgi:hypothetical protein
MPSAEQRLVKSIETKALKIATKESIADYFRCTSASSLTAFLVLPMRALTRTYYLLMQHEWFNAVIGQVITACLILFRHQL